MIDIRCRLPWPTSANAAWTPLGGKKKAVLRTVDYRLYRKAVGDRVIEHRIPRFKTAGARLAVSIVCRAPTPRDYDIDNRVKTLLDALAYTGVIENDKQIDLIAVARGAVDPPLGSVFVRIKSHDALPLGAMHLLFEMRADADFAPLAVQS